MSIDILQYALIGLAFVLWGAALVVAMSGNSAKSRFKKIFTSIFAKNSGVFNTTVIDRNSEQLHSEGTFEDSAEQDDIDKTALQDLRELVSKDKILFSEEALRDMVIRATALGGPAKELATTLAETAKASFPRIDGYIKIDMARYKELLESEV